LARTPDNSGALMRRLPSTGKPSRMFTLLIDLQMTATTLVRPIDVEQIDLRSYRALMLGTQGSESLVLQGTIPVLDKFRFVKEEVAYFECYTGCCQTAQLPDFMRERFGTSRKAAFAEEELVF
jgi:hypothetical protein